MPAYDDQQERFESSFEGMRTMCSVDCQCGRLHFVSADGHGDYQEGELEELQRKAQAEPEKYFEHDQYDYIDAVWIGGEPIVPDCPCGKYKRYCDWIEENAEGLAKYLVKFFEDRKKEAERVAAESARHVAALTGNA